MCERNLTGDDDFGILTYWVHEIAQKGNIEWEKDRSESWVTATCKKQVEDKASQGYGENQNIVS